MTNTTPKPPETIGDAPKKSMLVAALEALKAEYSPRPTHMSDIGDRLQKQATANKYNATHILLALYENAAKGKLSVAAQDEAGAKAISEFLDCVQSWVNSGSKGRLYLPQETHQLVVNAGLPVTAHNIATGKGSRRDFLGQMVIASVAAGVAAPLGGIVLGDYLNDRAPYAFTPEQLETLKQATKSKLALLDDPNAFTADRIRDTLQRLDQIGAREEQALQAIRKGEPSSPIIKTLGIGAGVIAALVGIGAVADAKTAPSPEEIADKKKDLENVIGAVAYVLSQPQVQAQFQPAKSAQAR